MSFVNRTGHGVPLVGVLLLALAAPSGAAAEPHARTAPFDYASRCTRDPTGAVCTADPVAMTTGAITSTSVSVEPPMYAPVGSVSSVGTFLDVVAPGSLTVTVDADVETPDTRICVRVSYNLGFSCAAAYAGSVRVSHEVMVPSAGFYMIDVSIEESGLLNAGGAIVKMITYEVTSS